MDTLPSFCGRIIKEIGMRKRWRLCSPIISRMWSTWKPSWSFLIIRSWRKLHLLIVINWNSLPVRKFHSRRIWKRLKEFGTEGFGVAWGHEKESSWLGIPQISGTQKLNFPLPSPCLSANRFNLPGYRSFEFLQWKIWLHLQKYDTLSPWKEM